jgi:phytol kinase
VPNDVFWLIASYVCVALLLVLATVLRGRHGSPEITRKIVHIGVGTWILPTCLYFQSPWMALIPPASFVVINAVSYRFRLLPAMEEGESNPGTIYFPIAFVLLILLCWPGALFPRGIQGLLPGMGTFATEGLTARLPIVSGIMALAWGDAAASIFGRRYGRRRYRIFDSHRSLEGTLAFLFFGTLGILLGWGILVAQVSGGARLDTVFVAAVLALPIGLGLALAGALLEIVTPKGLDNLSIPLGVASIQIGATALLGMSGGVP